MKVSELIELLQNLPPDSQVVVASPGEAPTFHVLDEVNEDEDEVVLWPNAIPLGEEGPPPGVLTH